MKTLVNSEYLIVHCKTLHSEATARIVIYIIHQVMQLDHCNYSNLPTPALCFEVVVVSHADPKARRLPSIQLACGSWLLTRHHRRGNSKTD